jgi:thiosulfate/3-mercaptopyruvate sulfurtransferase
MSLPPIISADAARSIEGAVFLDVRFYLDGRSGKDAYKTAHLPGAYFADLGDWVSGPPTVAGGRHPFPTPEAFAAGLGSMGVDASTPVVAYDDAGGLVAGRLVWMLRNLGHEAALLDGGLAAFGSDTEAGWISPTPISCAVRPWPTAQLVSADEVQTELDQGTSVADARAASRYRGETESVDARAGHIPGASNLPFSGNLDEHGHFRSSVELLARFESLGAAPIMYCGSGVSACHNLLALERAGIADARLFVGSWSAWSADPERPVATGPE